jgi:DNA-binding MarR family transcriptional regulator
MTEENQSVPAAADPLLAALERFEATISARIITVLMELGLTLPQLRALHLIQQLGQASGRQLAHKLGISPASVVSLLDRLEQQGYIERLRDMEDRRIWWVRPTPHARETMGRLIEPRARVLAALAALPREDRERLVALLNILCDAMASASATRPMARSRKGL